METSNNPLFVVDGASLSCTVGDVSNDLVVSNQSDVSIENEKVADITDGKAAINITDEEDAINIFPFGTCDILAAPCAPNTPTNWSTSNSDVEVGGNYALLDDGTLSCTVGGVISIDDANQNSVEKG